MTIFEFFKNFYSTYIFTDNMFDSGTMDLITAITTLLFFIAVFKGIGTIFGLFGKKK